VPEPTCTVAESRVEAGASGEMVEVMVVIMVVTKPVPEAV
jgi:hypothetical protein